jgi:hypothetical protein
MSVAILPGVGWRHRIRLQQGGGSFEDASTQIRSGLQPVTSTQM